MLKSNVISTTSQLESFLKGLEQKDEVKILSLVNYLAETIVVNGRFGEVEDRRDVIIMLLINRTNEYKNLLKN